MTEQSVSLPPVELADVPLMRLARRLQEQMQSPAHLDPEELAVVFSREYNLAPPVTLADLLDIYADLEISIEPLLDPDPQRNSNGFNHGDLHTGCWQVLLNPHRAATRKVQTLLHELYEMLRNYFQFWGRGQFPEGWDGAHFRPEQYARWFAASVALPKLYLNGFISLYGYDVELLRSEAHTSRNLSTRRLREVRPDTPVFMVECATGPKYYNRDVPACRCTESVRSREFSVALNRKGGRRYHIPRKREVWNAGPLVEKVVEAGRLVLAEHVTGFDLLEERNVCALAVPLYNRKNRLKSVAIYAIHPESRYLMDGVVERMDPLIVAEPVRLLGAITEKAKPKPRKHKQRKGQMSFKVTLRSGETVLATRWKSPRQPEPEPVAPEQRAWTIKLFIPTCIEGDQARWMMDDVDVTEEPHLVAA